MNKYTRLYLNYTKCGPFFNDYMGEFLVSIYIIGFSLVFEPYIHSLFA